MLCALQHAAAVTSSILCLVKRPEQPMLYRAAPNSPGNNTLPFPRGSSHQLQPPLPPTTSSLALTERCHCLHTTPYPSHWQADPSSDQMPPHTATQTARSPSFTDNPTSHGQWGSRRLAVPASSGRAREKESLVPLTKSWPSYLKAPLGPALTALASALGL